MVTDTGLPACGVPCTSRRSVIASGVPEQLKVSPTLTNAAPALGARFTARDRGWRAAHLPVESGA